MVRLGLGTLRLEGLDPARARDVVDAASRCGLSWIDTARSYAGGEELARLGSARVATKCGMRRDGAKWIPDGRAGAILAEAEESARVLGRPPELLLLHAPDPGVELAVSVRALARAADAGSAKAIGLANVTRGQLEQVSSIAPIAAVEVALGPYDDAAARGGVVGWCRDRGVLLLAYGALGGPAKVSRTRRDEILRRVASKHATSPELVMLAYLRSLDDVVTPLVGARSREAVEAASAGAALVLDAADLAALDARFPGLALARRRSGAAARAPGGAEVTIVMGIAGSGKSRLAEILEREGHLRLNRDRLGGTLKGIAARLAAALAAGERRVVLDNTYVSRASRSEVVRIAERAGANVRCVHVETSLADAQQNLAARMLERHGALLGGADLARRAKEDPGLFAPPTLFRMARDLEPPGPDEGFVAIESRPFVRERHGDASALVVPLELLLDPALVARAAAPALLAREPARELFVFGWREGADASFVARARAAVAALTPRPFALEVCGHAAGPPVCWCRPPLPGLWVAFARSRGVDAARSLLLAATPAQRTMARAIGLAVEEVAG